MKKLLLFCYLSILSTQQVECVKLQRVILSTNCNPYYSDFWPLVAPLWKAMGLQPTLAFVAHEDCQLDETLGDVIRFKPIDGVSEALQAQALRLLLPSLFPDDVCLISDIDMIPVSFNYYTDTAALCTDDNAFLVYRGFAYGEDDHRWPMCYVAAKGSIYNQIFGGSSIEEFRTILKEWDSWGLGWNTDELLMYIYVKKWEKEQGGTIWYKEDCEFLRIDRSGWDGDNINEINIDNIIDFHMPRPYKNHANSINIVVDKIKKMWAKIQANAKS